MLSESMPSGPELTTPTGLTGYVLKMYPRFSETFIVSEILAREAEGERFAIFSLRPPVDPRFHPELARVAAPVLYIDRPAKPSALWSALRDAVEQQPALADGLTRALPELLAADVDDAVQSVILARAALDAGVTHLHAHFASMATTVARLSSLLTGIPYSFTAHAKDLFHEGVDPADIALKLTDAHHTITVSDFNFDYLTRLHPGAVQRLHRVYNGLELDRFPFRSAAVVSAAAGVAGGTPPLRIVAVGRLVEKKGFALLIEAAARLRDSGIALTVSLVGDGELRADLTARITRLNLQAEVRLLGSLPQNEVRAVLAAADVFVAPCVVGADGNADGLPTVILEAMALGVPCVASDVTGIPEVVRDGDTGVLCRSGSVDDLVRALLALTEPQFDVAGMTRRARHLVEEQFDSVRQARSLRALGSRAETAAASVTSRAVAGMVAS
ncbi:colanic acid biosynthesis glycosyltransferase WcaL [Cryobacterium frigoriphilum]|uniref:Colanic acid biosynthesis glycosyltransferase WcaL n=1 Tax=Cryobacterium frigoriphilum TaxID=1259150 RepID=A0A4R8ZYV3_9MICO|nr:glycosyltransferase family 4 protein [Cryobacterium frigoriphilum]TFD48948.1 colanic acid biosynthesis glycosyltransferase WcaL [Cryobacterium frigoriphilum]